MTNQEAIKWIDGRILERACLVDNALLRSKAALEKQIPMAPERTIIHDDEIWKKTAYRCAVCTEELYLVEAIAHPVCGWERATQGSRSPFCHSCGQALKWEGAHV